MDGLAQILNNRQQLQQIYTRTRWNSERARQGRARRQLSMLCGEMIHEVSQRLRQRARVAANCNSCWVVRYCRVFAGIALSVCWGSGQRCLAVAQTINFESCLNRRCQHQQQQHQQRRQRQQPPPSTFCMGRASLLLSSALL